jgi:hypothetical protein
MAMPRRGDAAGVGWPAGADRTGAGDFGGGVGSAGGALPVWERLMVPRMVFVAPPAGEMTPCGTETGTKL